MLPDLFKRLKPLYGKKIDALWLEYQLSDKERQQQIEQLLTILAVKRLGIAIGDERIVLDAPPTEIIGTGEYFVGFVDYPGLPPYPFRLTRGDLLRHTFILGPTGTGKSTLILGLLKQLLFDDKPVMVFDFKRNYRCLLDTPGTEALTVLTVGRNIAPLRLNALAPPPGVEPEAWIAGLADVISSSYLLMQGARNVLVEALTQAHCERGNDATLRDAHRLLAAELLSLRPGSRRYGWLESSTRSIEELTKGEFGNSLNATTGTEVQELLARPIIFELQGLGDDQKRFFCLFFLLSVLQYRKNDTQQREVLRHALVFDEAHNVFPKDQYGVVGLPSRLAREVREYGEAIIAATQQADVAESLIANSGIKIILRTDYPKDVDFASKLLQVDQRWISKLPLGTGIARLPTRYYQSFLFHFPQQPLKNTIVNDDAVATRYEHHWGAPPTSDNPTPEAATEELYEDSSDKENVLLQDIAQHHISSVTGRYERLGWNPKTGNNVKDQLVAKGLGSFERITTPSGIVKILTLTDKGRARLARAGITIPAGHRGGIEHEYWRTIINDRLTKAGYAVTPEHIINDHAVDLYATKGPHAVIVEVETGRSDIPKNLAACNGANATVIFLFVNAATRTANAPLLTKCPGVIAITPSDLGRLNDLLT